MPLPGILGGFETRQKHFFHIFGAREKIRKFFFQEKSGKIDFFFGKNRDLSEIIGIFPKNRRFFVEIFLNDFSMDFSSPLQPITKKSPKNEPIFPIFCSLVSIGEVSSFFSHGQTATPVFEDSKISISPYCSCCRHCSSTMVSLRHSSSGFSSS